MKPVTYTLYKLTCKTSNKSYIGYTKFTARKRFSRHVSDFRMKIKRIERGLPVQRFRVLELAFKKYGTSLDVWKVETLLSDIPTNSEAKALEIHLIAQEDTFRNSYNSTFGGDGASGIEWSDEQKEKARDNLRLIKEKHPDKFGVFCFSKEEKEHMSKIKLESHWRSEKVLIGGVEYKSLRDAARQLNSSVYKVKQLAEGKTPEKGIETVAHKPKPYKIGNVVFSSRQAAADFYEVSIHNISKIKSRIEKDSIDGLESNAAEKAA